MSWRSKVCVLSLVCTIGLVGAAKRRFKVGVARGLAAQETLARATQRRRRSASLTLAHGLRGKVSNFGKLYELTRELLRNRAALRRERYAQS